MGYSGDNSGKGETPYVAGQTNGSSLASVDSKTFSLSLIGHFNPAINGTEPLEHPRRAGAAMVARRCDELRRSGDP
jgi:hypothetical protein